MKMEEPPATTQIQRVQGLVPTIIRIEGLQPNHHYLISITGELLPPTVTVDRDEAAARTPLLLAEPTGKTMATFKTPHPEAK